MVAVAGSRPAKPKRVMRVLIVDDNRDNMLTLGVLLRSEGYIVHMAKSGSEALRVAAAFPPNVALLDLVMPDRSGFEVAEELKRRYRAECPVLIAITAHDNAQSKERAELVGFHHFVAKPYDPKTLLRLIGSLESS